MHTEKSFLNLNQIKPNFDCNNTFPIDLLPNEIPFGAKSIEKVLLESKFDLIRLRKYFSKEMAEHFMGIIDLKIVELLKHHEATQAYC